MQNLLVQATYNLKICFVLLMRNKNAQTIDTLKRGLRKSRSKKDNYISDK